MVTLSDAWAAYMADNARARDAYVDRDTELAHDMERGEAARPQNPRT